MTALFAAYSPIGDDDLSLAQWLEYAGAALLWLALIVGLVLFSYRKRKPRTEKQHQRDLARGHKHIR
ncbi:MAG TPA: hypothetical protein VF426_05535 [Marmoricola sp.]